MGDFFIWRKTDASVSRYLDFSVFGEATNFRICDVVIDITAL